MTDRRSRETGDLLLARLRLAGEWTQVADLAREGFMGTLGFGEDRGTLARLRREGYVESRRWGRRWEVRAVPAVLGPLVVEAHARGAAGDVVDPPEPARRLCPQHGRPIIWRDGSCRDCPREVCR